MAIILRSIDNIYGLTARLDTADSLVALIDSRVTALEQTIFKQEAVPTVPDGADAGDIWYKPSTDVFSVYRQVPPGSGIYTWSKVAFDDSIDKGTADIATTAQTVFDSLNMTIFRSADYLISYEDVTNVLYGSTRLTVQHNGTVVNFTEYAIVGDDFCTFNAVVNGSNIDISVTTNAGTKIAFTKVLTVIR